MQPNETNEHLKDIRQAAIQSLIITVLYNLKQISNTLMEHTRRVPNTYIRIYVKLSYIANNNETLTLLLKQPVSQFVAIQVKYTSLMLCKQPQEINTSKAIQVLHQ